MVINRNESKTFYDDTHLEIRAKQTNLAESLFFQQAIKRKLILENCFVSCFIELLNNHYYDLLK